ncbi:tetratricopeptide repeat protein [Aeromonas sp. R4-3]|uniref:tetratricopeptide repeat protein n=1 Tax=Aeromonas sp. R4-3 TaxID=3138466 RepID=UPI0034A0DE8C
MNQIRLLVKRSWRESRELNKIANMPLAILFSHLVESGKGSTLIYLDTLIPAPRLPTIASYYFAHAYYLHGKYDQAKDHLARVLIKHPYHADATYLQCSIDDIEGRKDNAWEKLTLLARNNRRLKTWLVMANLVEDEHEFSLLYRAWQDAITSRRVERFHLDVSSYIATGALRAGLYDIAINIWEELIEQITSNESIPRNAPAPNSFSRGKAERALLDIKMLLDSHRIEFFLVSGTLLGCIREGRILLHDKDADIGVWSDNESNTLLTLLRTSGLFYLQASRSQHVIRVKHVNGTAIDVFIHYREPNDYWHGGVKLKWSNTPFKLTSYPFLGTHFNIPDDYDLYLTENYGEWRIPREKFDSSTDTTNASIMNQKELAVSIYRKLADSYIKKSETTVASCLATLSKLKSTTVQ